jgi:hypothetical protein
MNKHLKYINVQNINKNMNYITIVVITHTVQISFMSTYAVLINRTLTVVIAM